MGLHDEIREQTEVARRLVSVNTPALARLADRVAEHDPDFVFLAARGTSDHAGLYAKYLWGVANRMPVALAAPSMFSLYDAPPRIDRSLVVAISQSGQSPDIVKVVEEGRQQGAPTLAITNDPDSPLARAAEIVIEIQAGEERSVAATKTYTAQLMVVAAISAALSGEESRARELASLPDSIAAALELDEEIRLIAERYRYVEQCVVLGRGYNYATAYEWSLKLKELTYMMAAPYSSADFRHGPIAVVAQGFPVFAVATSGAVFDEMMEILEKLRSEQRAELLILSDRDEALALAERPIRIPAGIPEWLSPVVTIVAAQLFCYHLTRAKGFDTDEPRGLSKVTRSW